MLLPFWLLLVLALLATLLVYRRFLKSQSQEGLDFGREDESVLRVEMFINGGDGADIDKREFVVDSPQEDFLVGASPKSNWYRPELARNLKLRIFRDGRLKKWVGWRWRELFPGDPLALNDGMSLGWSFQFISRDEWREEGR